MDFHGKSKAQILDFHGKSKAQILDAFGYSIRQEGAQFVAQIDDDPEAFTVTCATYLEAETKAYNFLCDEVSTDLHTLPDFT